MAGEQRHPTYLWWNGERRRWDDATVHVTELGWSTVGAVFEGIRAYWNDERDELYVFRLDEHLDRLERSMRLVRLERNYSLAELKQAILDLLQANETREDTYIRPLAYAAETSGKRLSQVGFASSLLINTHAMPTHLGTGATQTAKVSSWRRISEEVMPPRAKNLSNYRNSQLASSEAKLDGYDTAILLNQGGTVAECPGACVMLMREAQLITPDLTSSILESITRDALLHLARHDLGLDVVERPVDRTELYLADEVFSCGTAAEITPIVAIDHYTVGSGDIGPVTKSLETLFLDVLKGREEAHAAWRTPVGVLQPAGA
ncbi:MAG TPA: branched-chain amino acid transaminase [Thermomicrobiales bacterium]|nr:branched-chain amino acid transaminase [Thermomicrobiales bacterium]